MRVIVYVFDHAMHKTLLLIIILSRYKAVKSLSYLYMTSDRVPEEALSLSTVVLNSRDRQGIYGMQHFCASRNPPYNRL